MSVKGRLLSLLFSFSLLIVSSIGTPAPRAAIPSRKHSATMNTTRWFVIVLILLAFIVACRVRLGLADCESFLRWGATVGHGERGEISNGCALAKEHVLFDLSTETTSPQKMETIKRMMTVQGNNKTSIPRILHQSYKSTWVPNLIVKFVQSWHAALQDDGWKFVWWTDDDLEWLLRTHYPQYAKLFNRMPHAIMKADTARYFILHHFGGVYADMDISYHNDSDENESLTANLMHYAPPSNTDQVIVFHECTDNSLIASTRNATFWEHVFDEWSTRNTRATRSVHKISGVGMFGSVCQQQQEEQHLSLAWGRFDVHHGTNSWRWKTKQNDIVTVLDVVIAMYLFLMGAAVLLVRKRSRRARDE